MHRIFCNPPPTKEIILNGQLELLSKKRNLHKTMPLVIFHIMMQTSVKNHATYTLDVIRYPASNSFDWYLINMHRCTSHVHPARRRNDKGIGRSMLKTWRSSGRMDNREPFICAPLLPPPNSRGNKRP